MSNPANPSNTFKKAETHCNITVASSKNCNGRHWEGSALHSCMCTMSFVGFVEVHCTWICNHRPCSQAILVPIEGCCRVLGELDKDPMPSDPSGRRHPSTKTDVFNWKGSRWLQVWKELCPPELVKIKTTWTGKTPSARQTDTHEKAQGRIMREALDTSRIPQVDKPALLCAFKKDTTIINNIQWKNETLFIFFLLLVFGFFSVSSLPFHLGCFIAFKLKAPKHVCRTRFSGCASHLWLYNMYQYDSICFCWFRVVCWSNWVELVFLLTFFVLVIACLRWRTSWMILIASRSTAPALSLSVGCWDRAVFSEKILLVAV